MKLPEIVFGTDDKARSEEIRRLVRTGKLRRLLPRVYTSLMDTADRLIILKHLWQLIATLYPGSLLSHRSAIEFKPSPQGFLYLTAGSRRVYRWPGVTLKFTKGPEALPDDNPIWKGLNVSSLERASLENLKRFRISDGEARAIAQEKIEERLLQILNSGGEAALNAFRDRARNISEAFGWEEAFRKLDKIISGMLSTRPADVLKSPVAVALALGKPYDSNRVQLFVKLAEALRQTPRDRCIKCVTK